MHLPAVQPADLSPLSSFQYLEHLSVSIRLDYSMLAALPNPIKLSRLRSLAVSSDQFSAIGALVAAVEHPIHGELSNVLSLLVARCPALITFSWTSDLCQENEDRFRPGVLAELIAPLLSVRTIRNFSASFKGHVVSYAPSGFRAFAGAWPELETLELRNALHSNKTDVNAYADFESLVSFAHHCPRLRRLYIPKVKFDRPAAAAVVRPSAPHWLRSLVVETVILCEEQLEDEVFEYRLRTLKRLVQEVFPEATIDVRL
uniref:STE/STE11 protein kinase n=1 Tax=Ganoderma boninense TaxID=34458 RepID=A0A5K1JVY9_9APHY|nr:STE/STE11 protein kinase [Ganoderma boninense]